MSQELTQEQPKTVVFLKGKRGTVLRPLAESDLPNIVRWINDPDVRQYIMNAYPRTERFERDWYEKYSKPSDTDVVLVIEVGGKAIGTMGIHGIDFKSGTATTGALIGEKEYWGKGHGTDAKMALLDYAFNTLGLRKICSRVLAFNERSLAYSLHCGYKIEGRLRKHALRHGVYYDEIVLGLFKEEWLPYWKKYSKKGGHHKRS